MFAFTINLTRARRRGLSENRIGAPTEFRLEGGVVEKRPATGDKGDADGIRINTCGGSDTDHRG
jgi:hypothetical protein